MADHDEEDDDLIEEEDEDDKYDIKQFEKKMQNLDEEIYILTSQIAPWFDRMGRAMIDLSPHIAMMSHSTMSRATHNMTILSLATNDGSVFSYNANVSRMQEPQIPERINRILNPSAINSTRFRNAQYRQATELEPENMRNTLQIPNGHLKFEVPVILTPGELLNLNPSVPSIGPNEPPIQLHLETPPLGSSRS